MSAAQIAVTLAGLGLIGGLGWFLFRPRKATEELERDGLQVRVVVKGGYLPGRRCSRRDASQTDIHGLARRQ